MPPENNEREVLISTNLFIRLFKVAWVCLGPDWWIRRNNQSSFWRLYRNEESGAEIEVDGERTALCPDRLYFIPSGVKFSTHVNHKVGQFYIHFDVIGLPHALATDLFSRVICLPDMPDLMQQSIRLSEDIQAGYHDEIKLQCRATGLLYQSLGAFFEHLSEDQQQRYTEQSIAVAPVLPAIQAMEKRYAEQLPNAELAQLCCMSETYFITRFRDCVGDTPNQYLQAYRIRMAAQSLLFSDATVDQVAEDNGFASRSHFIRMFRRHTGMTPTEYRHEKTIW